MLSPLLSLVSGLGLPFCFLSHCDFGNWVAFFIELGSHPPQGKVNAEHNISMMGGCLCDYGPTGVERGTQALELTQACQNRIAIAAIVLSPTFNHLFQCFAPLRFGILTAYARAGCGILLRMAGQALTRATTKEKA